VVVDAEVAWRVRVAGGRQVGQDLGGEGGTGVVRTTYRVAGPHHLPGAVSAGRS
jgi:hypothetical protein